MKTTRPTRFHPHTGLPIVPLGYRKDGRAIWPIMGGSGDGDAGDGSGDGDAGDSGDDGSGDDGDSGDGDGGDDGADDGDSGDDSKTTAAKDREIARLRKENASARVKAKNERDELVQSIGKALGLVKDGEGAPTVEQLTKQLGEKTQETEQARADQRDTKAELVVYRHAATLKVDPAALTDSRAFVAAIKDLDPSDAKFEESVKKAAQEAVKKNPKLAATQAVGSSSADHGGTGGGANGKKPKTLADSVSGHYGT